MALEVVSSNSNGHPQVTSSMMSRMPYWSAFGALPSLAPAVSSSMDSKPIAGGRCGPQTTIKHEAPTPAGTSQAGTIGPCAADTNPLTGGSQYSRQNASALFGYEQAHTDLRGVGCPMHSHLSAGKPGADRVSAALRTPHPCHRRERQAVLTLHGRRCHPYLY